MSFRFGEATEGQSAPSEDRASQTTSDEDAASHPDLSEAYFGESFYDESEPIFHSKWGRVHSGYDRWAPRGWWRTSLSYDSRLNLHDFDEALAGPPAPNGHFSNQSFHDEPSTISAELFRINYVNECWPDMEWAPEQLSDERRDRVLETG